MLRHKARQFVCALSAVTAAFFLTSCFDAKAGIAITADDLVNGNITITPDADHAARTQSWQVPPEFENRMSKTVSNDQTGETKITFSGLGFEEAKVALDSISDDRLSLDIERTPGDQLSVSGKVDLSNAPGASLNVALTFPEAITKSNGHATNGSTVEWTIAGGETERLWATAPAGNANRSEFFLWTVIASAIGLLSVLFVVLWARRTRDMHDF